MTLRMPHYAGHGVMEAPGGAPSRAHTASVAGA
jgi:hypothetical protein